MAFTNPHRVELALRRLQDEADSDPRPIDSVYVEDEDAEATYRSYRSPDGRWGEIIQEPL